MEWHKLLLLIASLAFIIGTFAEEIEIPDDFDIDDEDLDEDEEILRLLEEKRIVSSKFALCVVVLLMCAYYL